MQRKVWTGQDVPDVHDELDQSEAACRLLDLPLVAVGELHVHAVSAEEGSAVHWRVNVGRVRDGFTHQDSTGERRLSEAAQPPRGTAVIHF